MLINDNKKFFLIATDDPAKRALLKNWIEAKFTESVIYTANDYMECLVKIKNVPPNLLITDFHLNKGRPGQILDTLLSDPQSKIAIITMGANQKSDLSSDGVTVGRLQFISHDLDNEEFFQALGKVANHAFQNQSNQFKLRFLQPGEILLKEGDSTQQIYIVKRGLLRAFKKGPLGEKNTLGEIQVGEFVGEMAFFNEESRMASIEAMVDSELIEIQPAVFEKVIYQRSSWAKTLFLTLTKRLKSKT